MIMMVIFEDQSFGWIVQQNKQVECYPFKHIQHCKNNEVNDDKSERAMVIMLLITASISIKQ